MYNNCQKLQGPPDPKSVFGIIQVRMGFVQYHCCDSSVLLDTFGEAVCMQLLATDSKSRSISGATRVKL